MTISRRAFGAGASALASIAILPSPARAAEYTFKWGHATQANHPLNVNAVRVRTAVAKASHGRLDVQIFGNNVLGGDTAMLAQVRSGAIQMYSGFGGFYANVAPIAGIEAIGFAFRNQSQALRAFDGPLGAYVRKEIDAKGGVVTFDRAWVNGFRQITTSTKPIVTIADMQGLKIRTPAAKIWVDMFSALGASPTPINASEMYTAMQTHIVDAQENPFTILETYRLFEVQKYISVTNHMWSNFWVVANADAYKNLPPDLQTILRNAVNQMALLNRREMELSNNSLADKLTRLGMKINIVETAPFRARLKDFYAKYKGEYGSAAWDLLESSVGRLG
ncbi:MAG: TRAP transporter substrate-binding protein [Candidatus Velthaea sp.]